MTAMTAHPLAGQGSLCERVFSRLADEIVLGQLPPGTHLDEKAIASRCGVSRTPVREALKQLAATGLANYRPHRGSVVRSLTSADLDLMFEAIAELESSCARYAALRMTLPEREALRACHALGRQAARERDMELYDRANREFHALVFAGAHNPFLQETTGALRDRVMPFRRGQFARHERLEESVLEHSRVVNAILAGDAEAAGQEMRNHLLSARMAAARLSAAAAAGAPGAL
ncbi:GntR family transcriptional regulator [Polaromonas sp. YR568]|uniref:GntR family transcriptional regulator n=1 Tax=Polaromonas sp. YR568 TaxID=1855301 RepID=UPI00398BEED1